MAAFAAVLEDNPRDPLESEWVAVQSRGMKQWISAEIAVRFKICANMAFVFPGQMVEMILAETFPLPQKESMIDSSFLFWSVLDRLTAKDSSLKPSLVHEYTKADDTGVKTFQLAKKTAALFDDYITYRPEMLLNWQKGSGTGEPEDPHALWQAQLWNSVVEKKEQDHPAWQTHQFLTLPMGKLPKPSVLPDRLSFFGISALPPLFLEMFNKISSVIDINMFVLAPSDGFFLDLKSNRERLRFGENHDLPFEADIFGDQMNPLLASFGQQGRDYYSRMEAYDYHEPVPNLFSDPINDNPCMLTQIQSDILNLAARKKGNEPKPSLVSANDGSITVHSCHSPMREAQAVKDLLLDAFEKDADLCPHDIIVMMPDIEAYAPFIESVFSLEHVLPFAVSDRKKRSESAFLEAFLMILSLKSARLEKKEVMDLISQTAVMEKFGFDTTDIPQIEKIIDSANILWGRDGRHRQDMELPGYEENTWDFGLKRLFMGMAMPDNHDMPVRGVMPCHSFEGPQLALLGQLAQFCDRLFKGLDRFRADRTIDDWCRILADLARQLLIQENRLSEDMVFLYRVLDDIGQQAKRAGFQHAVSFETARAVIEQQLDISVSQGSFLSGKITFCNIMPMRSIPYKIVVMMGMDEASFPRQMFGTGFNLMAKYPKAGDKNERLEDRYLFLETLLSARQQVIITYTGQDIRDNSPIPCAGPVSELMDVMADSFSFPNDYQYHFLHRLHPFDPVYFEPKSDLFSYSSDNCQIASALFRPYEPKPFLVINGDEPEVQGELEINMDDLLRFFTNPCAWTLKEQMRIVFARDQKEDHIREPFVLSGLDRYSLGAWLLETGCTQDTWDKVFLNRKSSGLLPYGKKGTQVFDQVYAQAEPLIEIADKFLSVPFLSPVSAIVSLPGTRIAVSLTDVRENGLSHVSFGRVNGRRLIRAWIVHLCLNLAAPENYPKTSRLITPAKPGKNRVEILEFQALGDDARPVMESLVRMFRKGMDAPVCFFCETSYQFVRAMEAAKFEQRPELISKAMQRCARFWHGDRFMPGEKADRYAALAFSGNDPFENIDTLLASGFIHNALQVFQPMLEQVKVIS